MEEILHKYFAETITDSEKAMLFDALSNNPDMKEEFVDLQNIMAVSNMMPQDDDKQWSDRKLKEIIEASRKNRIRTHTISVIKYAAVAVLVSCIWLLSDRHAQNEIPVEYTYIEVPKGQTVQITLPDQTQAWLSSRTKLKFSNRFNQKNRIVELDGEGYFAVNKNTEKPFIVNTKQYNVEVTGTEFNVFSYSQSPIFEADLIEGSVSVYNKEHVSEKMYLLPDEKAYLENGKLSKTNSRFSHSHNVKNGTYSFADKPFDQIVARLELWYDVKIRVKKAEILSYSFSGKFRQSDSIEQIMQAIKETGKFDFKIIDENVIEIY